MKVKFKAGDRVCLPASGDCRTQYGVVLEPEQNGVVAVRVDESWREEDDRDGLCEVPVEDVRLTTVREDRELAKAADEILAAGPGRWSVKFDDNSPVVVVVPDGSNLRVTLERKFPGITASNVAVSASRAGGRR